MSAVLPAPARRRKPGFYGWPLLGVFWLIVLANLGLPMYGGSVLYSAMAADFGFSRQMLGLPFAVFLGTVGLSSPLVALILQRMGVRRTMALGNVVLAAAALIMGVGVQSAAGATLVFGLMAGFGVAAGGNLAAQTAIPRWFVRRRALAFALMLTASATGGLVAPPLLTLVISRAHEGWRTGWLVICAAAATAAILAAAFVRNAPEEIGQSADGESGPNIREPVTRPAERSSCPLSRVVSTPSFWAMSLASAFATGGFGLILAHGIAAAKDAGYSPAQAALSLSVVSVSGFAGKAIAGPGGDRFSPAIIWAGLMGLMAAGLGIAAFGLSGNGLFVYTVLLGAGFGGVVVCQPATIANTFGTLRFAQIASLIYFLQAIAGVAFPWAAGRVFDQTHTYQWSFAAAASGALLSGCLLLACRRNRRPTRRNTT